MAPFPPPQQPPLPRAASATPSPPTIMQRFVLANQELARHTAKVPATLPPRHLSPLPFPFPAHKHAREKTSVNKQKHT
jgi:hypothetical protein